MGHPHPRLSSLYLYVEVCEVVAGSDGLRRTIDRIVNAPYPNVLLRRGPESPVTLVTELRGSAPMSCPIEIPSRTGLNLNPMVTRMANGWSSGDPSRKFGRHEN